MASPQIYATTFGLGNTKGGFRPQISLKPKGSAEFNIVINGDIDTDRDILIPQPGETTTQAVNYNDGGSIVKGTLELSLENDRFWLILKDPDIVWSNWAGVTDNAENGTPAGQFVIATWTGAYQVPAST